MASQKKHEPSKRLASRIARREERDRRLRGALDARVKVYSAEEIRAYVEDARRKALRAGGC